MHSIINHIWKVSLLYFHTLKNIKVTKTVFFKGSKLYVKRDEWRKMQTCLLKRHHYQLSSFPGFVIYSKWVFFQEVFFLQSTEKLADGYKRLGNWLSSESHYRYLKDRLGLSPSYEYCSGGFPYNLRVISFEEDTYL